MSVVEHYFRLRRYSLHTPAQCWGYAMARVAIDKEYDWLEHYAKGWF